MGAAFDVLCEADADREEWLEARHALGLGASEIPSALGIGYQTRLELLAAKRAEKPKADTQDDLLWWGRFQEAPMLEAFREETGRKAWLAGDLLQSTEEPIMLATLDGRCIRDDEEGNVECKLAAYSFADWDEGVPERVVVQAQSQMFVAGAPFCSVLVLLRGYQFRWADVERDDRMIEERILPAAREFWSYVEYPEKPVPVEWIGDSEADRKALVALHPEDNGETISLEGEASEWGWALLEAKNAEKAAKARADHAANRLRAAIGDATFGVTPDGQRFSLKTQETAAHMRKASKTRVLRRVKGEK